MNEPFSAGRVLSRSLSVWLKNFVPFAVLALVCYAPVLAYVALSGPTGADDQLSGSQLLLQALELILQNVVTGATAFGVFQALRGQRAGVAQAITVGLRRLLPVLGVALASGLLVVLGLVALVVPGLFVRAVLYVAVPVAVIERRDVGGSLARSAELTRDRRLAVLGVFALALLFTLTVQLALAQVVGVEEGEISWPLTLVVILMMPFGAVTHTVAYHDLRMEKEGPAVEELARALD
jgi:hypothetical protein